MIPLRGSGEDEHDSGKDKHGSGKDKHGSGKDKRGSGKDEHCWPGAKGQGQEPIAC